MAQLRNAQFDCACPGLPVAVAVAVAVIAPFRRSLAYRCSAELIGLQRHQTLSRKADHLAQEAGVRTLLQKLAKGDLVIGHRGGPRVRVACRNPTLPSAAAVTTAVDKQPAYAVTLDGRSSGLLTHSSYTTPGDATKIFNEWC